MAEDFQEQQQTPQTAEESGANAGEVVYSPEELAIKERMVRAVSMSETIRDEAGLSSGTAGERNMAVALIANKIYDELAALEQGQPAVQEPKPLQW